MPKKKKSTIIAIPSYGRQHYLTSDRSQNTSSYIPPSLAKDTYYYVEDDQAADYEEPLKQLGFKSRSAARGARVGDWGSIMDLIIEECLPDCHHLIIMDDDLRLEKREDLEGKSGISVHAHHMSQEEFGDFVEDMKEHCTPELPLLSGQYRAFCQGKRSEWSDCGRVSMVWCLNCAFFRKYREFRFTAGCPETLIFMQDYWFFMRLLQCGVPNRSLNSYLKHDTPNADGGISRNRVKKKFNTSVKQFASLFPEHVKTYEKIGKGSWGDGFLGVRMAAVSCYKAAIKAGATPDNPPPIG